MSFHKHKPYNFYNRIQLYKTQSAVPKSNNKLSNVSTINFYEALFSENCSQAIKSKIHKRAKSVIDTISCNPLDSDTQDDVRSESGTIRLLTRLDR